MTIYTASDGLANNQVITLHVAPDGRVYFGTRYGLSIYSTEISPVNVVKTGTASTGFSITGNYPNPFNQSTSISFWLSESGSIKLDIFTITGAKAVTLTDGVMSAGEHSVTWNASGFPSGVYLCRLKAGRFTETRKMLLVK